MVMTQLDVPATSIARLRIERPPPEHAERAGEGVDHSRRDTAVLRQAEFGGRLRGQWPEIGANRRRLRRQPALVEQIRQAHRVEEIARPPLGLMRWKGPFAGGGA
jgi:hypothetical protein